ncbi:MAG: hypothetical protein M1831_002383 [Alyxoria varia]|nr:MAG: hypothetical protein M1831_002383 [Alyxoria varia]
MSTLEQPYRSANRPVPRKPVPNPATPSAATTTTTTTNRTSSSTLLSNTTASTSPLQSPQPSPNQPSRFSASKQPVPTVQYPEQSYSSHVQASRKPTSPTHNHTRTASSGVLPPSSPPPSQPQQQQQPASNMNTASYQPYINHPGNPSTRRTLSNATTSTTSTTGPTRKFSNSSNLQRSTSSRSGNGPSSYVAQMRRQKATVWSDRAQFEDPRMLAVQRAAKQRAAMEISGTHLSPAGRGSSSNAGSSLTGGVRSKIRHHGAPKAQQYAPTANPASGVPMRLSAREVDEEDSDDDNYATKSFHNRSGSGRSSVGSAGRVASAYGLQGMTPRRSSSGGNTPPQNGGQTATVPSESAAVGTRPREMSDTTPMANQQMSGTADYFGEARESAGRTQTGKTTTSGGSGGSENSEQENSFGGVSGLPQRVRDPSTEHKPESLDDLQRRGSVDERTMTMRGYGKLFVANPDLSD